MTVTNAVVIDSVGALSGPARFSDLDIVRLDSGGFALLGNDSAGLEIDFFDQNGLRSPTVFTSAGPGGSMGQLGNGDLVIAHQVGDSVQFLSVNTSSDGGAFIPAHVSAFAGTTHADVGAGQSSFAVVSQLAVSATDSNIELEIYGVSGDGGAATLVKAFAVDSTDALDTDASVAVLKNGNVAVAWTRTTGPAGPNASASVLYAVYDPAGNLLQGPVDIGGGVGFAPHPSVAATADGGFAIGLEARVIQDASVDIKLLQFDENGAQTHGTLVSNRFLFLGIEDGSDDANPFVSAGPDGNIAVSYTRTVDGDADTVVAIVKGSEVISDTQANIGGDDSQQTGSVVSFFGTGQLAAFDVLSGSSAEGEHLKGDRDAAGDGDGDPSNDVIVGDDFTDLLNGVDGDDTLSGGRNNDNMFGGEGEDALSGGDDQDTIAGEAGNDFIEGGAGSDTIFGGGGGDVIFAVTEADAAGSIAGDLIFGEAGADTITGSSGADKIVGGDSGDDITGGDGADTLDGSSGADVMEGGFGDDLYFVDNLGDLVFEDPGKGTDTVAARSSYVLTAGAEVEILKTTSAAAVIAIDLTGNEFAQSIFGNGGRNIMDGKGGADTMTGGKGDDFYFVDIGGAGGDVVVEGSGGGADTVAARVSYTLGAGVQVETLRTTSTANTTAMALAGNEFGQTILGNSGANTMNGRGGHDVLRGLGGADAFVFDRTPSSSNYDHITDFAHGVDKIRLDHDIFATLPVGALAASAFKDISAAAEDADDRVLYKHATGGLYYDSDGAGGAAAQLIAVLDNHAALTASDVLIIA